MPLAAGARLGPYEILAPVGAGGMGEVYRALDRRLAREVAVKVLPPAYAADPERLGRFEQEARAAGGLNHPNVVAIFDVGTHDDTPYVVSEYVEGETLRERLAAGPLPARRVVDIGVQIALGLAAAHDKQIVHRDLKPENVVVSRDGRVKILDFGLAKLRGQQRADPDGATAALGTPAAPVSDPGKVLGTAGYMSPEQVRGQDVDHRSDLFSLGAILYEMLTGRRAFQAGSAVETMSAILREEPPELALSALAVPPGFEPVVRHCLEKSPDERFQSARDLAFNLQALTGLSGLSGAAAPLPAASRLRPAAAAGLLALALLPVAFFLGRGTAQPTAPVFRQVTFKRGAVVSARLAPDGQTVVYGAAWSGAPFELFSARPGSPESRPLGLSGADILDLSPSGEMALALDHRFRGGFQFSGTLARAPLAGGAPRQVLENVFAAAWAPDGQDLAVVRRADGRDRLEYPVGHVLYQTAGWISDPRFSPSGDRIAFFDHPNWPDDGGDLAVVDRSGRKTTVAAGWYSALGLAWSPRGDEIWFTASKEGKGRALRAASLSGRGRLLLRAPGRLTLQDVARDGRVLLSRDSVRFEIAGTAPGEARERDLSWLDGSTSQDLSADGRTVLFSEGGEAGGGSYSIYLRGTEGSPAVRLGEGLPTQLSPDGQWALTISRESPRRIVLLPTGPGEPRALAGGLLEDLLWALWLPDGKSIVVNGAEVGHGLRSYLQPLAGGAPRPVTPEGVWTQMITRDGRAVLASSPTQALAIYPLDGGAPRPVAAARLGDRPAGLSGDGRRLYVFRRDELPCRVDRIDLATGRREPFRALMPGDPAGVVAVQEVQLAPDAGAYVYSYLRMLSELYVVEGLR